MRKNILSFMGIGMLITLFTIISAPVGATPITFSGSGTNLSASATFEIVAGNLQVTLANTSTADVVVPADVLTALFFNITGIPSLTPVSATLGSGSTVLFGPNPEGGVVGGEWAYTYSASIGGANQGISSSGLGIFGGPSFPGSNLDNNMAVDGLQYGITSAGDITTTGNTPVTVEGGNALIKNSVVFQFSLPNGLTLDLDSELSPISNVRFQYGTALDEPSLPGNPVPEPATMLLLGSGLIGLAGFGRKKFKKQISA